MAKTLTLEQANALPPGQMRDWAYNALDCTGTREVWDALYPRLDAETERTYRFERALHNPSLAAMRRGIRVDLQRRADALNELNRELRRAVTMMNKHPLVKGHWDGTAKETGTCPKNNGKKHKWPRGIPDPERSCLLCGAPRIRPEPFNALSHHQVRHLVYDIWNATPVRNKTGAVSVDDDCLKRVAKKHEELEPLTEAVLDVRGIVKQIGTVNAKLSPRNRWHQTINVGAAWTGRFSSSKSPFGEGGNTQNISERHRIMFIPDAGMEMCYADLERAESMAVAFLAGDEKYIEAHNGDTHTFVARLLWPELPWTGDLKADKSVAKVLPEWDPIPGHDFRFQAKRVQHGGNYGLTPQGISMIAKIPLREAKRAYYAYHDAFPGIKVWQENTRAEVKGSLPLRNPAGRKVSLFGRPWDEHTYKQGLSYRPQSLVADILDTAWWYVWKHGDPWLIQLLAQVHDAILSQFKPEDRAAALTLLREAMTTPIPILGADGKERIMTIPVEIMLGKNWGKKGEGNPNGMDVV